MDSAFYKSFMVSSIYFHNLWQIVRRQQLIASANTNKLLFCCCFDTQNVDPVGKRFVVAVDVSTSLSSIVPGTSISTAVAAAAITMVRQYWSEPTVWLIVVSVGTAAYVSRAQAAPSLEEASVKELVC